MIWASHVQVGSKWEHAPEEVPGGGGGRSGGRDHDHAHDHAGHDDRGPSRNLGHILGLLRASSLPPYVRSLAGRAFYLLAVAEARTHGASSPESVHFHEVGAVDSIVDTVGTCSALYHLGVGSMSASPLPLGRGYVRTDHGLLPVPAPATLRLMEGLEVCPGPPGARGELCTPTGVALLRSMMEAMGRDDVPEGLIAGCGFGAGSKDFDHPNVLRVVAMEGRVRTGKPHVLPPPAPQSGGPPAASGDARAARPTQPSPRAAVVASPPPDSAPQADPPVPPSAPWTTSRLAELVANVDDCTPEVLGYTIERLLELGCVVDAWTAPIGMKKNRSATQVHALLVDGGAASVDTALEIIFRETTTLGIRVRRGVERAALSRRFLRVDTGFRAGGGGHDEGTVQVKLGTFGGTDKDAEVLTVHPEYEDCRSVALACGKSLRSVADAARRGAEDKLAVEKKNICSS